MSYLKCKCCDINVIVFTLRNCSKSQILLSKCMDIFPSDSITSNYQIFIQYIQLDSKENIAISKKYNKKIMPYIVFKRQKNIEILEKVDLCKEGLRKKIKRRLSKLSGEDV